MHPFVLLAVSLIGLPQIPAGTQLHMRLSTAVGSYATKEGATVSGVLIAPVAAATGEVLLPEGSTLTGSVKRVKRVGFGVMHETATLEMQFNKLVLPSGEILPLPSRVYDVDNSRERVIEDGSILGVRSTATIAYRISGYIRTLLAWEIHARLALWAVKMLLVQVPEPEIYYRPGSELTLSLTGPMTSAPVPQWNQRLTDEDQDQLRSLVSEMPYRATAAAGRPSDLINMMFVGTREQIAEAFAAAGWEQARRTTFRARVIGAIAVADGLGYSTQPMSKLRLNDAPPDMSWQKGLNDVAKRHHVRIWKQPGTWDGQELWVGAATRDVDYAYLRPGSTVTHRIEQDIDRERDKIAYDLQFTSCTNLVDWWERPGAPLEAHNATGDPMTTDGRLAIIRMNDCDAPRIVQVADSAPLREHGNYFERLLRRQILSVRSDFYRRNMYWRSYEGTRWLVTRIKHRHPPPDEGPAEFQPSGTVASSSLFERARNSSWLR
jgi:hypothetical protein